MTKQTISTGLRVMRTALGMSAAVAALTLSASAFAADEQGMVVVRDAETGQLRAATAKEFGALKAEEAKLKGGRKSTGALPESSATVGVVKHKSNGAKNVHLGEESMVYSVITKDADGKMVMQCVTGKEAAEAAVTNPKAEEHKHDVK